MSPTDAVHLTGIVVSAPGADIQFTYRCDALAGASNYYAKALPDGSDFNSGPLTCDGTTHAAGGGYVWDSNDA